VTKGIEEANLLGRKLKVETKKEAKKRAKDAKATMQAEKEKEKAALALAALEIPKSMGVGWNRQIGK
jgi:hypothetical protein